MRGRSGWSSVLLIVAASAASLAVACGVSAPGRSEPSGSADLAALPQTTVVRYRFIEAQQDLAAQIPCYCGCGVTDGHRSLRDCFLDDQGAYSDHAAGCAVCLGEAQQAESLLAQGLTPDAIRAQIDDQWSAIGPPTETP